MILMSVRTHRKDNRPTKSIVNITGESKEGQTGFLITKYAMEKHPYAVRFNAPTLIEIGTFSFAFESAVEFYETWLVPEDDMSIFKDIFNEWYDLDSDMPFVTYWYTEIANALIEQSYEKELLSDDCEVKFQLVKGINLIQTDVRGELLDGE